MRARLLLTVSCLVLLAVVGLGSRSAWPWPPLSGGGVHRPPRRHQQVRRTGDPPPADAGTPRRRADARRPARPTSRASRHGPSVDDDADRAGRAPSRRWPGPRCGGHRRAGGLARQPGGPALGPAGARRLRRPGAGRGRLPPPGPLDPHACRRARAGYRPGRVSSAGQRCSWRTTSPSCPSGIRCSSRSPAEPITSCWGPGSGSGWNGSAASSWSASAPHRPSPHGGAGTPHSGHRHLPSRPTIDATMTVLIRNASTEWNTATERSRLERISTSEVANVTPNVRAK